MKQLSPTKELSYPKLVPGLRKTASRSYNFYIILFVTVNKFFSLMSFFLKLFDFLFYFSSFIFQANCTFNSWVLKFLLDFNTVLFEYHFFLFPVFCLKFAGVHSRKWVVNLMSPCISKYVSVLYLPLIFWQRIDFSFGT